MPVGSPQGGSGGSYRERIRRAHEHPGYIEQQNIRAFAATLTGVYRSNRQELSSLLDRASSDSEYIMQIMRELGESMARPGGAIAEFDRLLHNYVASSMTLVDHSRRLMQKRTGSLTEEYELRKIALLRNPEVAFIQGLRNFSLHRALPLAGYSLSMTPTGVQESELQLGVTDLLEWDGWKPEARALIAANESVLPVRPVVARHYAVVYAFNEWLLDELNKQNSAARDEVNRMIISATAALRGVDFEVAQRQMEEGVGDTTYW
jgi:hypothetical protein